MAPEASPQEGRCGLVVRRAALAVVLAVAASTGPAAASRFAAPGQRRLEAVGSTATAEIAASESQTVELPVEAGAFVTLRIDHTGELRTAITEPSGATASAGAHIYPTVPDVLRITLLGKDAGTYLLAISASPARTRGPCTVTVEIHRSSREGDRGRLDLAAALEEADARRVEATATSLPVALVRYQDALSLARAQGDTSAEALALTGLGRATDASGDRRRAVQWLTEAVALHRDNRDRVAESYALDYLAVVDDFLGDRGEAARLLDRALSLAREATDARAEGIALNNLGLVSADTGDRVKAIEYFTQALPIHQRVGNVRGQATTLTNLGSASDQLGDKPAAIRYLTDALALRRQIGDPREEAGTQNNLGVVYMSIDDLEAAGDAYRLAIEKWRMAGDVSGEAATRHNIAAVLEAQGDYQGAIDQYTAALALHRHTQSKPAEGNTLSNLGRLYAKLGDHVRALDAYGQALAVHRVVGNRTSEATTLTGLGVEQFFQGAVDRARADFTQALTLYEGAGDRLGQANALIGIGRMQSATRQAAAAIDSFTRALALTRAVASRRIEAVALTALASERARAGETGQAWPLFDEALALERATSDRSAESATLYSLARAERQDARWASSHEHLTAALALVEAERTAVAAPNLRMSYFATVQDYFELDIDVLTHMGAADPAGGWLDRALEVSERARARRFLDVLVESRVHIREGVDPALLARERALAETLSAKAERHTRLLAGPHTDAQLRSLTDTIRTLTVEHEDVETRIRTTSPRYAALTRLDAIPADVIRHQVLDAGTVLLEYVLGTPESHVLVVSRTSTRAFALPSRAVIEDAVARFYRATRTPDQPDDARTASRALGRLLLGPFAASLRADRLAIVASDSLQYVPFAALVDPALDQPLVTNHEIVSLPSASALAAVRAGARPPANAAPSVMVFADPVFDADDPRIDRAKGPSAPRPGPAPAVTRSLDAPAATGPPLRLERLIGSRREAAAIGALFGPGRFTEALGFDANRAAVTSEALARFDIVHFATHALVNSERPELSGIVVSQVGRTGVPQDGFIGFEEVFNLHLRAALVVLSACQTALGQDVRGEGLIGLSRAFMYAGTPRVVATTWKVDDAATAELMKQFYQQMTGPKPLRPAAALRAAQLAVQQNPRWQAPYYWAPFVLQGEWR